MIKQRARDDEDKALRREQILRAGRAIFDVEPFSNITMSKVADQAGLAKGTLYLYCRTKESLFVQLVVAEMRDWIDDIRSRLDGPLDLSRAAAAIAAATTARPRLQRLLALLFGVFEQNLDEETARTFKLQMVELLTAASGALTASVAGLGSAAATRFFIHLYAAVVGLAQMSYPSQVMTMVFDTTPELAPLRTDFDSEIEPVIAALLKAALDSGWA